MNFNTLPNLFALAILVGVFAAILRRGSTERLHLWLAGWILVLTHFVGQFFAGGQGVRGFLADAVSYDALILAGIAFLISVSTVASNVRRQVLLASAIGLPALAYTNFVIWEVSSRGVYYAMVLAGVIAPCVLFCRYYGHFSLYAASVVTGSILLALATAWSVHHGAPEIGISFLLAGLNFCAAILFWRRYRRPTAGVLTSVSGLVLWGAVFPTGLLMDIFAPSVKMESEVWNIPKYLVAVGMILTLLEDQIETSKYLAYHDDLTGLPNRRLLDDRLEQALASAARARQKVAVLQLDLDHFKEVNDTFGHRVGDLALREVVQRLGTRVRASDTLARSGGDEFTIVGSVKEEAESDALASALEASLSAPIQIEGHELNIGLSIGVALFPDDGRNADQLHSAADHAMYKAKRASHKAALNTLAVPPPNFRSYISAFEQGPK